MKVSETFIQVDNLDVIVGKVNWIVLTTIYSTCSCVN